jgi:hypothetical protein
MLIFVARVSSGESVYTYHKMFTVFVPQGLWPKKWEKNIEINLHVPSVFEVRQ